MIRGLLRRIPRRRRLGRYRPEVAVQLVELDAQVGHRLELSPRFQLECTLEPRREVVHEKPSRGSAPLLQALPSAGQAALERLAKKDRLRGRGDVHEGGHRLKSGPWP